MADDARIPVEEYPKRLERLRAQMKRRGLDALLLGTGMNLAYFSGYPSPAKNVSRPYFLLLPLRGDPVFISHSGHKAEAARFSWIADVREYTELSRVPVELIADAMRERSVFGKNVGMELGFEQTLDISHLEFCRLGDALGETNLVDASGVLWQLRMIKSPHEIACLREACRITAESYAATFSEAREGMLEREIFNAMYRRLNRPDTGSIFLVITSGKRNYDLVTKPPEDRPVERGDMVWMDAGVTVSGYWSDFSSAGVVGDPTKAQVHAQQTVHRITTDAVRMVRPGVKASDIARFCYARLDELDFPITSSIAKLAVRIGHGVGLNLTEPPHIGVHDDTPLEAGMVITLEPGVATEWGTFHVEENVLVTVDGYEVLSESPRELWRIALT